MDVGAVAARLRQPDRWRLRSVRSTGSTNGDLAAEVQTAQVQRAQFPPDGTVLITEEQTAGRGRSGRQWTCPAGAGLMFSVAVDAAAIPPSRRPWTGVAMGLAAVSAFSSLAGVRADLKWPNDVMISGAKCGGILAESVGDIVIVGAGLNITLDRSELPRPEATSLLLAGSRVDRNALLAAVLDALAELLDGWRTAGGDVQRSGLRSRYLAACATIGTRVRLELPGGGTVTGTAVDVDDGGAIVLEADGQQASYAAGDVVHLRPAPPVDG